jgi:bifunctional DNase/RNase
MKAGFVKMVVGGLKLDDVTKTPIVVLKDDADSLRLPIWIGLLEATSMATELEGVKMNRPMTHDLLKNLLEEFGAIVESIEVTALRENTFYAMINLAVNGEHVSVDSRPSDAISLALRTGSPIYVAREVLEASSVLSESVEEESEGDEEAASESHRDLSDVSPEEWSKILEKLDPEDFEYKM